MGMVIWTDPSLDHYDLYGTGKQTEQFEHEITKLKKLKHFEQLKTLLIKHKTDVCEIVLNKF